MEVSEPKEIEKIKMNKNTFVIIATMGKGIMNSRKLYFLVTSDI